ncbi:MAG TPA: YihA family ribosome biogenesis GTP-binding protein [Gammaproteobacteria bacterium]|nr:MAG: YihA family ribosome biogenesis GTP-binding protein [Gammaproteobacteria bacterium TMED134]RPG47081.1 MAG: YihA family ribosome biogenesis GTP-binding protein [Gammaproteobacteria bacterium TMED134]RZO70471.1 MAG: YihA family ribosome biogenesis GTP-binding protein [OM182 bacterium]HAL42119.1 YihA family ribosome biogenesis GTP-binding protein [Gammaproteobacteria bacterium]|tara:strand:+ start:20489 stop:21136 length:648 start_codon:yes stop_codon:yes gene_type:complete
MTEKVSLPERLEATFLTSAPDLRRCPPGDCPEVAFAGRSNAGKSSVLNELTGNRKTAKVSKTPGRTQLLNFFDVRTGGRMVDLPGYGYAKAGRDAQQNWQKAVNHYLSYREALVGIVLVMDIRHPNQAFDQELLQWSHDSELPVHILLNKADKLSFSAQRQALQKIRSAYADFPLVTVQCHSALRRIGTPELLAQLFTWLGTPITESENSAQPQD